MGPRTVGVLFILSVVLTTYYWFFERDAAPWEKAVGPAFPGLEYADLAEIEIIPGSFARAPGVPSDPIQFYRRDEESGPRWWIRKPAVPAHHPRIESIAHGLIDLQRIADVPGGEAPGIFAAEGPEVSVRFRTRSGEEHRVEVGKDHSDLDLTFVRVDGERLFLTRRTFRQNLNSRLDDLRSRALFPVPRERAAVLEVRGDPRYAMRARREAQGPDWRFEAPQPAPGGREALARVLDDLNAWGAEGFVRDEEGDLAPYGLDSPRTVIAVTDLGGATTTLEVGKEVPGQKGLVYVKWGGQPFIMTARAAPAEALERPAEHLYSEFVLQLGAEELVELRAKRAGGETGFVLRRAVPPGGGPKGAASPGGAPRAAAAPAGGAPAGAAAKAAVEEEERWTVEVAGAEPMPGDPDRTRSLVGLISRLPIKRYCLEDAGAVEKGAEKGSAGPFGGKARLTSSAELLTDQGRRRTLLLGRPSSPEEEAQKISYVRVEGESFSYQVLAPQVVEDLEGHAMRFRDRRVSTLAPETLRELEVAVRDERGDLRTWDLGRPRDAWRLTDPDLTLRPQRTLDEKRVEEVVLALGREAFRVEEWMPEETDLVARGVDAERFRIRLTLTEVDGGGPEGWRLYLGEPYTVEGTTLATWGRVNVEGLAKLPCLLDRRTARAVEGLAAHLEEITERAP